MKQPFLSSVLSLGVLLGVGLGCGLFNKTESTSTGNTVTTSPSSPASPASDDIAGSYDITGMNENGAGAYRGTLAVTNRGDVYQFSWDTAGKKYDGVGIRTGDTVASAFASGDSGEGCGVVLYKIGPDGTLDGKAGYWGNNSSEKETAKRIRVGADLDGEYEVNGTNTAGDAYSGKLSVRKSGAGYTFSWNAGSTFEGFGIRQGDMVAVGFGGSKCGFVSYVLKPGGTLEGKWGGYGSKSVGTETAKRN